MPSEERCEQAPYTLDARIRRGMDSGDELTFARAGEQRPGMIPGDVKIRLRVCAALSECCSGAVLVKARGLQGLGGCESRTRETCTSVVGPCISARRVSAVSSAACAFQPLLACSHAHAHTHARPVGTLTLR